MSLAVGLIAIITLTSSMIVSSDSLGQKERFANFYAAPENSDLIAMASERPAPYQRPNARDSSDDDEPRFSIGLGTLAPSYSQKFGLDGRTRLDFDHHKDGFSYTLTNNHHPAPNQMQVAYDTPQESKAEYTLHPNVERISEPNQPNEPNVKIYYNQRFTPYAAAAAPAEAEANNYFSHVAFPRESRMPFRQQHPHPYQGHSSHPVVPSQSKFQDLVEKFSPRNHLPEYRDQPSNRGSFHGNGGQMGHPSPHPSVRQGYQGNSYNPGMAQENGRPDKLAFNEFDSPSPFNMAAGPDDGDRYPFSMDDERDSYTYPLPFHQKNGPVINSNPRGFEYVNRITSSPNEYSSTSSSPNDYSSLSFNSGLEPVVFSTNIGRYSGLDSHDAFAAYIAGIPLTP